MHEEHCDLFTITDFHFFMDPPTSKKEKVLSCVMLMMLSDVELLELEQSMISIIVTWFAC
jgi:hypothetical protein